MEPVHESNPGDQESSILTHVSQYGPLQAVPLTLAPFVLAPSASSALPSINIVTPDANKFGPLSIPDSGVIVEDSQMGAIQSDISEVLNTRPLFMSTNLDDTILSSNQLSSTQAQVFIPISPNHGPIPTLTLPTTDETNFERLVSFTMDHSALMPTSSRTKESSSSSTTTTTSPLDEDAPLAGAYTSVLPLPLQLPGGPMQPLLSSSPAPQQDGVTEVSESLTSQTTEQQFETSATSSAFDESLGEPNPNRKKRSRVSVNYAQLDQGMLTLSDPEQSPQVKRPKTAVTSSPPSVVSVTLAGAGATRRFGARLHSLLLWFDLAEAQSDSISKFPSLVDLSDICTDLHTINLVEDFNDPHQIAKFVSTLRLIQKLALNEPFTKECLNPTSMESQYAHIVQFSMLSAVCMLYLLAHPTFDRRYLTDECLDESCQSIIHCLTGFIYAVIDDTNANARPMDIEFDVEAILKPKRNAPKRSKREKSPSWQQGPFASITTQLITLIYESLNLLSQLMGSSNLPDEHIIRLLRICRLTVFAHGLHSLLDASLTIMRKLFVNYPSYRQTMLQDVFEAIGDLANGQQDPLALEHGSLHLVTHVILQLLQANPDTFQQVGTTQHLAEKGQKSPTSSNGASTKFRPSYLSRFFVKTLLDSILDRFEAKGDTYVIVCDRLIHDLLASLFRPEWPASEMILRDILQHTLHLLHQHQIGSKSTNHHSSSDVVHLHDRAKMTFGTWLSLIGTKLVSSKLYTTTANLMKRPVPGDVETRLLQEGSKCSLCVQAYSGKKMASCNRCLRWFHVECYGITFAPHDSLSEWLCDACLVGSVYDMIVDAKSAEEMIAEVASTTTAPSKRKGSKKASISRPSFDESNLSTVPDSNVHGSVSLPVLDHKMKMEGVEGAQEEGGVEMSRMHFAMKILTLNYLNEIQDSLTLDAKRYLLRNWILEHESSEKMEELLFHEQWAPTTNNPFIHLPLGPFRPSADQLDSNLYVKLLQRIGTLNKAQISENSKIGLLPSRLALQIFAVRFSLLSNTSLSIFAYFPKIIDQFVTMMNSEQAKTRALALRAITNMVDADMTLLRDKHVYEAVEARLIDPSPLTREKALNMLGRFIIMNPSVVSQYAPLIRDRVEDSSISVRRRAVRIIRSVCLLLPGSSHVIGFCAALAKRIVRHGEPIKEMVLSLFREIWFTADETKKSLLDQAKADLMDPELPKADLSISMTTDDATSTIDPETEPLATHEKVNQLLAILKDTLRIDPEHDIAWFIDLLSSMKSLPKNPILHDIVRFLVDFLAGMGEEAELELERQKNCDDLVLQYEHNNHPQLKRAAIAAAAQNKEDLIRKRLLYSMALFYIAQAIPHSVCDHFHQLRTILSVDAPTPSAHSLEKKTTETVLGTLEMIIPFIRHPSEDVWTTLLKDLSQLMRSHGMPVIAASVKVGAAIARRTSANWIKSLYSALANSLRAEIAPKGTQAPLQAHSIIRFLFTLSMILKSYPLDPPSQIREKDLATVDSIRAYRYGPHVEEVYHFIVHFWKANDRDVKTSAVLSLGHLAPSSPGIFVRRVSEEIIASALAPTSLEQLKAQGLKTIHEFLSEEANRMKVASEGASSTAPSKPLVKVSTRSAAAKKSHATPSKPAKRTRRASVNSNGSQSDGFEDEFDEFDPDADNGDVDMAPSLKPRKKSAASKTAANDIDEMMDCDDNAVEKSPEVRKQIGRDKAVSTTDTGLSSTIVEIYIKRVLSLGVDKSVTIRNAALTLIEQILRMGLTHPAYCVPTLVALETDEVLGELAHRCLSRLDTTRVLNRIATGIQTSFVFQKTLYRVPKAVRPIEFEGGVMTYHSALGRLYSLFTESGRVGRNNFLAAAFGLYEAHSDQKTPFDAMFITYLTLLIAQFPFTTQEEALFAVYQTNRYITSLADSSLNRLKQFYKGYVEEGAKKSSTSSCPSELDVQDAIVAWHLLMLKVFLRSFYGLDSDRCRNFMPSDTHSTPVHASATTVNVQDWLHKIYSSFDGFLIESDWSKRPEICRKIYSNLKQAIKTQEDDVAKPHGRGRRANLTTSSTAGDDHVSPTKQATSSKATPSKPRQRSKTTSSKPSKKKADSFIVDDDYNE